MIVIAKPNEAQIIEDAWDYPIEELEYLLSDCADNAIFVLKDDRLYEAEPLTRKE